MSGIAAYSLADWEQAMRNSDKAVNGSNGTAVTMARFEQSAHLTPLDWLERTARDAGETVARVRALDELIDPKTANRSPGLIRFRSDAESAEQLLTKFVEDARARLPKPEPEALPAPVAAEVLVPGYESAALVPAAAAEPAITAGSMPPQDFRIRTREQAYQLLHEIADFLVENDPHSPTPYLIRRAANWGDMQFDALITELVRDREGLSDLAQLLDLGARTG
jgi:type VI secretion system ImpA family protein